MTIAERIFLLIYLNKRQLISNSIFDNLKKFIKDESKLSLILEERSLNSNFNESGLTETIINRINRFCFEDWFKTQSITVFNGKFKYKSKSISNEKINKMFWRQMMIGNDNNIDNILKFENMYHLISKNVQIKKKKITKKKRKNKISVKKPKYLNIFLKKKLKRKILKYISKSNLFYLHYKSYKSAVLEQYSYQEVNSKYLNKIGNKNINKFAFELKKQIEKTLTQILRWFEKKGNKVDIVEANFIKVSLKHIACPVTLNDHLKVFETLDSVIIYE